MNNEIKRGEEQPVDSELIQASRYLVSALGVSLKEFSEGWFYEVVCKGLKVRIDHAKQIGEDLGEEVELEYIQNMQRLVQIRQNTAMAWEFALSNTPFKYRERVLETKRVTDFANMLILQSEDPHKLIRIMYAPFPFNEKIKSDARETLPSILFARGYMGLTPERRDELLEARGASVCLALCGKEFRKLESEISPPGGYINPNFMPPEAIARNILMGIHLPEVPEI